MTVTYTIPVEVAKKLSELELDAGGKRIDNLGLGDTPDDVMRRSEKTVNYEVYGLLAVGLAANRPAPGIVDRLYFSTDTLVLERDTGVAWAEVARGEAAIRLAQLAERAHISLTGIGVADHHARYTDVEAQAQAAALIVIHTALAAAHHAKTTDAAEIVSGTFPVVRGGTGLNTIALGGILYASALDILSRLAPTAANQVLRSTAANALQFAVLLAADIPNLDASKITSGRFPVDRLPAMTDEFYWVGTGTNVEERAVPVAVSSGIIAMWHGTIATIPSGWVICDGNNSTPNLLTRFVQGVATAATNPGATGGATSHYHTMPTHYHTMGTHVHKFYPPSTSFHEGEGGFERVADDVSKDTDSTDPGDTNSKDPGDTYTRDGRPLYYDVAFLMKT